MDRKKRKKLTVNRKKPVDKSKSKSQIAKKQTVGAKSEKPVIDSENPIQLAAKRHVKPVNGVKRNSRGQIVSGSVGIGGGRRAGTCRAEELDRAIREVESEKDKGDWLKHLIRKSYKDTTLAVAILGRKFAALKAVEVTANPMDAYSEQECADIRKQMAERFQPESEQLKELKLEVARLKCEAHQETEGVDNA